MRAPAGKTLHDVAIFRALSGEARARVERLCSWRTVRARENIVHFQDESREVFFLIKGKAHVIIYSVAGKAVTYRDIAPGEMFGEYAAIDGRRRSASVEAAVTSLVACMPGAEFKKLLRREPAVMEALLAQAIAQVRVLTARIFEFSTLAVNNRIQAEVLRLARNGQVRGVEARIASLPTHAEIASRISTHREAVTRELGRLASIGLIEPRRPALVVKDVPRLASMVDDAMGE